MHHFKYKKNRLYCENVPIRKIAKEAGTPFYCYSHATLSHHFGEFEKACAKFPHLICFSVKSNTNMAVLRTLMKEGAGADIVSGGELYRVLAAGIEPSKIVFSGVGKTEDELVHAVKKNILLINVESSGELDLLQKVAKRLGRKVQISFRINPDIDPESHPYLATALKTNKFGIPVRDGFQLYKRTKGMPNILPVGLSCHIGSQITKLKPFRDCLNKIELFLKRLRMKGFEIKYLDLGGGLGIPYKGEETPSFKKYISVLEKKLKSLDCTIIFEPGRVIVGNAGILVTKVLFDKSQGGKNYLIVDAAMNDLIRPALYHSCHNILPEKKSNRLRKKYDIVGPICESGDFLAKGLKLPTMVTNDLVAVMSAGAYGFTMASNYNSRPRVAEVMVKGSRYAIVRKREMLNDLLKGEKIPAFLK